MAIFIFMVRYVTFKDHFDILHIHIIAIPFVLYIAFKVDQLSALFFATLVIIPGCFIKFKRIVKRNAFKIVDQLK